VQDLLWVLCLPVKQCVCSVSAHRLRISFSDSLLKWKTPTHVRFIKPVTPIPNVLCYASSITQQMITHRHNLIVHSCQRTTFWVFTLTAYSTLVHFRVLVWGKLQGSWCHCVKYIRIWLFLRVAEPILNLLSWRFWVLTYCEISHNHPPPRCAKFHIDRSIFRDFWPKNQKIGKFSKFVTERGWFLVDFCETVSFMQSSLLY